MNINVTKTGTAYKRKMMNIMEHRQKDDMREKDEYKCHAGRKDMKKGININITEVGRG